MEIFAYFLRFQAPSASSLLFSFKRTTSTFRHADVESLLHAGKGDGLVTPLRCDDTGASSPCPMRAVTVRKRVCWLDAGFVTFSRYSPVWRRGGGGGGGAELKGTPREELSCAHSIGVNAINQSNGN